MAKIYHPSLHVPNQKPIPGAQPNHAHPLREGLVGQWIMNEAGGDTVYDNINSEVATLPSGSTWQAGIHGPAVDLPGTAISLTDTTADIIADASEITISGWVYDSAASVSGCLYTTVGGSIWTGCSIFWDTSNIYWYGLGSTAYRSGGNPVQNTWTHYAFVWDGSVKTLYIDGEELAWTSGASATGAAASVSSPQIGVCESYALDGMVNTVSVYNRALSAQEIQALYADSYADYQPEPIFSLGAAEEVTTTSVFWPARVPNQKPMLGEMPDLTHPSRDGLVGRWVLNEGGGDTVYDDSGNGNDGAISGATWTTGIHGSALSFDGVNDNIALDNDTVVGLPAITVGAWVNTSSVGLLRAIIEQVGTGADTIALYMAADNTFNFKVWNDSQSNAIATSSSTYSSDQWYFVVGVYDGSTVQVYVDAGDQDLTPPSLSGNIESTPGSDLTIGGNGGAGFGLWKGGVSNSFIHNRALSAQEIQALYADSYADYQPEPIIITSGAAPATGIPIFWNHYNKNIGA